MTTNAHYATPMTVRQIEHTRVHLCHIYSVTVNQMMIANCKALEVKTSTYLFGTLDSVVSSLAATLYYKLIVIVTTSWISCQLRVIYPYAGDTAMLLHINKMLR